jgi:hypothetical protein
MLWILAAWAFPLAIFWGWYFLSAFNLHFGYVLLTRQAHELVFQIYGETLGIDPALLPGLVARACVLDTMLLLAILAFRRRARIALRLNGLSSRYFGRTSPGAPMVPGNRSVAAQRPQPVEHALKNEGGGGRIDLAGTFAARKIHLDQRALGGNRR